MGIFKQSKWIPYCGSQGDIPAVRKIFRHSCRIPILAVRGIFRQSGGIFRQPGVILRQPRGIFRLKQGNIPGIHIPMYTRTYINKRLGVTGKKRQPLEGPPPPFSVNYFNGFSQGAISTVAMHSHIRYSHVVFYFRMLLQSVV